MLRAQAVAAQLAAVRGDLDRMEDLVAVAGRTAGSSGMHSLGATLQWARGLAALGQGRHDEAYEQLVRPFRPGDPAAHYSVPFLFIGDLAEAARYAGRTAEVRALLPAVETGVRQLGSTAGGLALDYARAMLTDDEETEAAFALALTAVRSRPFLGARLQLGLGGWLRRQRRVVESRTPLRAARTGFDALGAASWADRARAELRASGVESRPRERGAMDDLTPQELQIAQLAASGLTNREIGERLFLSHRTVAAHLYRAFPKMGITSRGQLHQALPRAGG